MKNETKTHDRSTNSSRSVNHSYKSFRQTTPRHSIKDEKTDDWSLPANMEEQLNSIRINNKEK